jgi:hypothetical protein
VICTGPAHLIYDFDLFQRTLRQQVEQQPRGAIQVPPTHHWKVACKAIERAKKSPQCERAKDQRSYMRSRFQGAAAAWGDQLPR